jgi:alpha-L-rhamnosidase
VRRILCSDLFGRVDLRTHARWLAVAILLACVSAVGTTAEPQFLWVSQAEKSEKDYHVAFRGEFHLNHEHEVSFDLLGASWFVGWIDGEYFCEGPARFPAEFPQYQTYQRSLKAGRHVIALQVTYTGEVTRMMQDVPPFLYCVVHSSSGEIPIQWKCERLAGYTSQVERINNQFGYVEWCDTRQLPLWQAVKFDDSQWESPVNVERELGALKPLTTTNTKAVTHPLKPSASGSFVEVFGYEQDNPAARFFLRDLAPESATTPLPAQGVWRRYDLGRVRLMRPRFKLDLPAGAVVEFSYSEALYQGRVSPWIQLSSSNSCNLDHFVARGGVQEFFPLAPKGGRFMEAHVVAPPDQVKFVAEEIVERAYFDEPEGAFECNDPLLNRIWTTGVETLRACAEDALTDNPTRERGQWAGDVVSVGMDIAAASYSDLALFRRGLIQLSQCADSEGMVAALCPGTIYYIPTFATQWNVACVHYWELTGDLSLLEELYPAAKRNIEAFEAHNTDEGLVFAPKPSLVDAFVDWGYVRNPGPSDMATNLEYLAALKAMVRWSRALQKEEDAAHYEALASKMSEIIQRYFAKECQAGGDAWVRIGYHRAAFGLILGLFDEGQQQECVEYLKRHMLNCFPNNPDAPRLSDPSVGNPQLITPYFGHFTLPELVHRGEMDFVLDQYRTCWGWSLGGGRTTWLEVFDTRWTHCHQWAGAPTWQLSRYVLGLQPRYDLGERHYFFSFSPGSLEHASGAVPLPDGRGVIRVQWEVVDGKRKFRLETPVPIFLHFPLGTGPGLPAVEEIQGVWEHSFPLAK